MSTKVPNLYSLPNNVYIFSLYFLKMTDSGRYCIRSGSWHEKKSEVEGVNF